jgi:hypothetical protein
MGNKFTTDHPFGKNVPLGYFTRELTPPDDLNFEAVNRGYLVSSDADGLIQTEPLVITPMLKSIFRRVKMIEYKQSQVDFMERQALLAKRNREDEAMRQTDIVGQYALPLKVARGLIAIAVHRDADRMGYHNSRIKELPRVAFIEYADHTGRRFNFRLAEEEFTRYVHFTEDEVMLVYLGLPVNISKMRERKGDGEHREEMPDNAG